MNKIEFKNVSYSIPEPDGKKILNDISFSVEEGENFTFLGSSGAGKSTLLKLCNRLIDPQKGEIYLSGKSTGEININELRRTIGMVHQSPLFIRDLGLKENILYGVHSKKEDSQGDDFSLVQVLLKKVGLNESILDQDPETLSVGEAQRICLARTLATNPAVLLLDEPTSALDPASKAGIEKLFTQLRNEKKLTTILVTHDLEQAKRVGGKGALLSGGKILEMGEVEELLNNPKEDITKEFISHLKECCS